MVAESDGYDDSIVPHQDDLAPGGTNAEVWSAAYTRLITSLQREVPAVAAIVDTPWQTVDPVDCLAEKSPDACSASKADAFSRQKPLMQAEAGVRMQLGIKSLDLDSVLCPNDSCPVILGGVYVYSDAGHLYSGFVLTQSAKVSAFVRSLLQ